MPETVNKAHLHAELTLVVALLYALRPLELLLVGSSLIGVVSIAFAQTEATRLLALGVYLTGLAGLYVGFRIRVDAKLFEHWNSLDFVELDRVLEEKNPQFKPGRPLESRLAGTYSLIRAGVGLTIIQCCLLVLLAWVYAP